MDKKELRNLPATWLCLAALVICFFGTAYLLTFKDSFPYMHIGACFTLAAIVFAVYYVLSGFRKDGAKYFIRFLHFYCMAEFGSIVYAAGDSGAANSFIGIIAHLIVFGLLLSLATGKDLGKTRSYIYVGIIVFINVALYAATLALTSADSAFSLYAASGISLAIVCAAAITAKYADKAARGSK